MNRSWLLVLGLVAVLGIALFIMTRSSSGSDASERTSAPPAPRTNAPEVDLRAERPEPPPDPGVNDDRPDDGATSAAPTVRREYVNSQGVLVRDHRSGELDDEFNLPSTEVPGIKQKLERRVIDGVRESVYDSVRECRSSVGLTGLGEKPRAQAEVVVSIHDGAMKTTRSNVKFGDVPEDVGQRMSECLQSQLGDLAFDAAGHADISEYRVTLVFPLQD